MEQPGNFPDLNPMEDNWARVKDYRDQGFPNIRKTKEGPKGIRKCLAEAFNMV